MVLNDDEDMPVPSGRCTGTEAFIIRFRMRCELVQPDIRPAELKQAEAAAGVQHGHKRRGALHPRS